MFKCLIKCLMEAYVVVAAVVVVGHRTLELVEWSTGVGADSCHFASSALLVDAELPSTAASPMESPVSAVVVDESKAHRISVSLDIL